MSTHVAGRDPVGSALRSLLARDRYSDEEWEHASTGRCGWYTANYPGDAYCGQPSDPRSFYRFCTGHDGEAREYDTYGTEVTR